MEIEIEVEDAFRLRETKSSQSVELVLENLDEIRRSAEHVRVWWYPDGAGMVVGRANRVYEVMVCPVLSLTTATASIALVHGSSPRLSHHPVPSSHLTPSAFIHALRWQMGLVVG